MGFAEAVSFCQKTVSGAAEPADVKLTEACVLLLVTAIKLIAEIALLALVGQWLLGLLAGQRRDSNLFYQLLSMMTRPFVRGARFLTPKLVLDRHLPLVAFLLLAFAWVVATMSKISLCLQAGANLCK